MNCDMCKGDKLILINIKIGVYDTLNPDNDLRLEHYEELQFECLECGNKEIYLS